MRKVTRGRPYHHHQIIKLKKIVVEPMFGYRNFKNMLERKEFIIHDLDDPKEKDRVQQEANTHELKCKFPCNVHYVYLTTSKVIKARASTRW